jgi:hypothetical protein
MANQCRQRQDRNSIIREDGIANPCSNRQIGVEKERMANHCSERQDGFSMLVKTGWQSF